MIAAPAEDALTLVNVDKRFPGVHALKDVTIHIRPGEVVGLVGENGAGKSTVMKILSGVYQPDGGEIRIDGKAVKLANASDANSKGIGMVFQEQSLLLNLSVGENIYLGNEGQFSRLGIVNWRDLYAAAKRQLAKVHVDIDPRLLAEDLNFATRQMVELAKALTLEDKVGGGHLVILLDEPTSVLERAEIDVLFARVRALKERASFVFVSHRLDEVLELSDRIYVMKDGAVVADLAAVDANIPALHQLMVGRSLQAEYYREPLQKPYRDEVVLEAKGLSLAGGYKDLNFRLHRGEIVGIAGVVGSGREELTRTLAGFAPHDGGQLTIGGKEVHITDPAVAVDLGLAYIPRERRLEGLVLFLSVAANVTLADLQRLTKYGLIRVAEEKRLVKTWIERLNIKTPSVNTLCLNLSGGNQQKVVLAKWLNTKAQILILDHPTRGLDVGAKEEVYEIVRAITAEGIAIVVTSDTLEETIGLSHTVLVMRDGEIRFATDAQPGHKPRQVDLIQHMV